MDDALDKLSHALEVEPEFHDGRSYMLHIKSQQQAKEVCIGRYSKPPSILWLLRLAFCRSEYFVPCLMDVLHLLFWTFLLRRK